MKQITNDMDIIDSKDIIIRIAEIDDNITEDDYSDIDELEALSSIIDQAGNCGDLECGEALICEDYFTEYCQELLEDIGNIPKELPWYIENHIDWNGVAKDMKQDYTEVDFDGVSYFIRA